MLKGDCVVAPQFIDSIQQSFQPAPKRSLELGWYETGGMELLILELSWLWKNQDSRLLLLRGLKATLRNVVSCFLQNTLAGSNSPTRLDPSTNSGLCGYFGVFQP